MEELLQIEYECTMMELDMVLEDYVELTNYQLIYEAENNPDVSQQMQQNANVKEESKPLIKKLIDGVIKLISNVVNSIKDFFTKLFMSQDEREQFRQCEEYLKAHPELANKKITVKNFRSIQAQFDEQINAMEAEMRRSAAENTPPATEVKNRAETFLKTVGLAAPASFGLAVAIKACRSNIGMAKEIQKQLNDQTDAVKKLEEIVGKEQMDKFKNEVNKDTKLLGFHRVLVSLRKKKCESLQDCIVETIGEARAISKGEILNGLDLAGILYGNEHLKPYINKYGKMYGKAYVKAQKKKHIDQPIKKAKEKATKFISNHIVNRGDNTLVSSTKDFVTGKSKRNKRK